MDEAWQVYYEEVHDRSEGVPDEEADRTGAMREIAGEAFESTMDRLVNQLDFSEDDAEALTRAFERTLRRWVKEGHDDWDELLELLETSQEAWEQSSGFVA